jgi:Fe2+ or Zn2+ uptake regulation protein
MSKQREAIQRAVAATCSHPTADWVYQQVRRQIPRISMGTVYRNLKTLVAEGRLVEISTVRGPARYDANLSHHSHFRCLSCGRMEDIEPQELQWKPSSRGHQYFKVVEFRVELAGVCSACAGKRARSEKTLLTSKEDFQWR